MNNRKRTFSNLKKYLVEEDVPRAIQATLFEMYSEMYTVAKCIATEATAYVILRRFCTEELE